MVWELDSVSSGWNLVANTHSWSVGLYSYEESRNFDEDAEISFWRYDSATGEPEPVCSAVKPYEAVWAHVGKKTKWTMSGEPVFDMDEKFCYEQDEFVPDRDSVYLNPDSLPEYPDVWDEEEWRKHENELHKRGALAKSRIKLKRTHATRSTSDEQ